MSSACSEGQDRGRIDGSDSTDPDTASEPGSPASDRSAPAAGRFLLSDQLGVRVGVEIDRKPGDEVRFAVTYCVDDHPRADQIKAAEREHRNALLKVRREVSAFINATLGQGTAEQMRIAALQRTGAAANARKGRATVEAVQRLKTEGFTHAEIAERLGRTKAYIDRVVSRHKIAWRRPRKVDLST